MAHTVFRMNFAEATTTRSLHWLPELAVEKGFSPSSSWRRQGIKWRRKEVGYPDHGGLNDPVTSSTPPSRGFNRHLLCSNELLPYYAQTDLQRTVRGPATPYSFTNTRGLGCASKSSTSQYLSVGHL